MMKFKSWRWSRLTDPSALKRFWLNPEWIMPFFVVFIFQISFGHGTLPPLIVIKCICWGLWFLLAIIILQNICCADEYFEIKSNEKICHKIYLYNTKYSSHLTTTEMHILGTKHEVFDRVEAYHYDFFEWNDFTSFLFWINGICYYSSPVSIAQPLGKQLKKNIFYQPEHENKIIVLDDHGTMTLEADAFFLDDAYIPQLACQQIFDDYTNEKLDKPQDYLIARRGKKYTVYGLYDIGTPSCHCLRVPNIIFKEGSQDVILQWNESIGYREIFRSRYSVKRKVSDIFVELTYQHGIGGTVRKFNEQTQKLDLLYKGYFHAIDFDSGNVIGDNGYKFMAHT